MRVLLHSQSLLFPFPPRGSSWRAMGLETRTRAATIQVCVRYVQTMKELARYLMPSHHAPPSSAGNTSYQATALRSNSPQTLQYLGSTVIALPKFFIPPLGCQYFVDNFQSVAISLNLVFLFCDASIVSLSTDRLALSA